MSKDVDVVISDTIQNIILGITFTLMFAFGVYTLFIKNNSTNSIGELEAEIISLENDLAVIRDEQKEKKENVIYETTGIRPHQIRDDGEYFDNYISPAFTWDSGEQYDEVRGDFIDRLGEKNSFVKEYLVENISVEKYNYVDTKKIRSKYLNSTLYPLSNSDTDETIEYLGVVEFYVYQEEQDLEGVDRLPPNRAFLRFTMRNDSVEDSDKRIVEKLSATAGF